MYRSNAPTFLKGGLSLIFTTADLHGCISVTNHSQSFVELVWDSKHRLCGQVVSSERLSETRRRRGTIHIGREWLHETVAVRGGGSTSCMNAHIFIRVSQDSESGTESLQESCVRKENACAKLRMADAVTSL